MQGLMMDFPLTLDKILERSGKLFGSVEIVSRRPDRSIHRTTYSEFYRRARALAESLQREGIRRGDRVATLMWNHSTHLEAYFGIPASGGVLHTLNLRLHPKEIAYIVNHAEDRFLIVDDVLLPLYEQIKEQTRFERVFVVPFGGQPLPAGAESYEDLLSAATGDFAYPALDEKEAAAMCFTSGTTGNSKGVLYSHRALVLHAFISTLDETFGINHSTVLLPACPMFHANSWGVPFTARWWAQSWCFRGRILTPKV
jgi:fatty-acyl-CoA synthase